MKNLMLASVALIALTAGHAAQAADMPVKVPLIAPVYNWTGCYVGVHAGAGVTYVDTWEATNGGGGLAGGQVGCNYQAGQIVVGVEGEGWWSGLASIGHFSSPNDLVDTTARNRWDVDIALRAGFAIDRALIYGKVGAAWGRFDFNQNHSFPAVPGSALEFERGSGTLGGLLLGTGLEYAFADNWSAKLEYNYIAYLGRDLHFDAGGGNNIPFDSTVSAQKHIVKAGINYRFGDPVAPPRADMPVKAAVYKAPAAVYNWTGCYAGVHGGGGVMYSDYTFTTGGGGLAGGQVGCNYQTGALVVGVEGEGWWSGIASKLRFAASPSLETDTARNRWDAAVALRAGLAVGRVLVYHKVGAVWGRFDFADDQLDGTFERGSSTSPGLLLGTGLEYAFAGNWTAKLEYNYLGYVGRDVRFVTNAAPFIDRTLSATKHIVKAGVNYKLGDPVIASAAGMPALPAPTYSWTGCYAGVHGGGGVMRDSMEPFRNGGGGLAGGQVGCNYQTGRLVFGIEGEGWWSGLASRRYIALPPFSDIETARNRGDVDIAARVGLAVERVLVYGKVGAAWGRFDFADDSSNGRFQRGSGSLTGLMLGTGLEYALTANWSAKLEYDYIGYLGRELHFDAGGGSLLAPNPPFDSTVSATKHIGKLGLNYRFGDPVVSARY